MTYEEWIRWLEDVPKYGHKDGVKNIQKLLLRLGSPEKTGAVIHVAGTNGKGSICAMLSGILAKAGYRVGMYTSPHLVSYTERIQVQGHPISEEDFLRLGLKVQHEVERMVDEGENHCTFFEILTAMAYLYFAEQSVDFVVLETGVGGRLDATNTVEPPHLKLCVIASISKDHTKVLGDDVRLIAAEKAGIFRRGVPVVLSRNDEAVRTVIAEKAAEVGAPVVYAGEASCPYPVSLKGDYQKENAATVVLAVEELRKQGLPVPEEAVKSGLANTFWPGRMQEVTMEGRTVLLDGAHNPDGVYRLCRYLDDYEPEDSVTLVFCALGKKDTTGMLRHFADCRALKEIILTRIHGEDNETLFEETWRALSLKPMSFEETPIAALKKAVEEEGQGLVVAAGSLYLIGELLEQLGA